MPVAAYALLADGMIRRASDGAIIPADPLNQDYVAAQAWIAAGHTPDPYVAPPPPSDVSYGDFRARFTDAEKSALHSARQSVWQIDDYVGLAQANGIVSLGTPEADAAKAALVAAGVLTQSRANTIFTVE